MTVLLPPTVLAIEDDLEVLGHQGAPDRRPLSGNPMTSCGAPLGGMGRRHPDVDHQLGRLVADQCQELNTVAGLPHHVKARALEQAGQTLAEKDVVLGQDHAPGGHGCAVTLPPSLTLRLGSIVLSSIRPASCVQAAAA
jgi:hypothetical protein